jgi:hypothetical protein
MASDAVDRPIKPASGTIARHAVTKTTNGCRTARTATREIGTKTSSQ